MVDNTKHTLIGATYLSFWQSTHNLSDPNLLHGFGFFGAVSPGLAGW